MSERRTNFRCGLSVVLAVAALGINACGGDKKPSEGERAQADGNQPAANHNADHTKPNHDMSEEKNAKQTIKTVADIFRRTFDKEEEGLGSDGIERSATLATGYPDREFYTYILGFPNPDKTYTSLMLSTDLEAKKQEPPEKTHFYGFPINEVVRVDGERASKTTIDGPSGYFEAAQPGGFTDRFQADGGVYAINGTGLKAPIDFGKEVKFVLGELANK